MRFFQHKRVKEIKTEHWRAAVYRIQEAIAVENEKLQSGDLDDYPQEKSFTEGLIEAYENALEAIQEEVNKPVL